MHQCNVLPPVVCRQVEDLQFQVVEGNVTGDEVQVASDVDRACLDEIKSENLQLKQRLQELEVGQGCVSGESYVCMYESCTYVKVRLRKLGDRRGRGVERSGVIVRCVYPDPYPPTRHRRSWAQVTALSSSPS